MSEEKKTTKLAAKVQISGLGKFPMRLTELGGKAVSNGAVIKLPIDQAKGLVERYPDYCKLVGANGYSIPTEEVPLDFTGEIVSGGEAKAPTATGESAKPTVEGKATNKAVAKAPVTKG